MARSSYALGTLSLVCVFAGTMAAQAQDRMHVRHRAHVQLVSAPPLTVKQRSWLDMGNVVAVGTQQSYLSANESLHEPVYQSFAPDRFGQSTLPGRFDLAFSNENPRGPSSGGIFFDQ